MIYGEDFGQEFRGVGGYPSPKILLSSLRLQEFGSIDYYNGRDSLFFFPFLSPRVAIFQE